MEKKKMKIPEFRFWPYMVVAMGGSYIAFMVAGDFVSNNFESVIGISGFLIAGSWSYLTIETNKEIRIRDEVLGFINGYEQAILEYVEACNDFVNIFHEGFFFYARKRHYMKNLHETPVEEKQELLSFIKNSYGIEQISNHDKELMFYENKCVTKRNIVLMRGRILRNHISKNELIDEIDSLCEKISKGISETVKYSAKNVDKVELKVESEAVVTVLKHLSEIMEDKVKEFDVRSGYYSNILGVCMFFIMFGFFFFVWNLMKI